MKKEKKKRISLKEKVIGKITSKVQDAVDKHDNWFINKVCERLEYLALNTDYDLEKVIEDLKNYKEYAYDKEKHIESN